MIETWKQVEGWPYEVSDLGRVRSLGGRKGAIAGRILKLQMIYGKSKQPRPYGLVALRDYPRTRLAFVHILILEAFVGPRPTPKHQGNHLNGLKLDNRVGNLEWVTASQNIRHAIETGLNPPAPRNVKIPVEDIPRIRERAAVRGARKVLAREYGVHVDTIDKIVKRRCWGHIP